MAETKPAFSLHGQPAAAGIFIFMKRTGDFAGALDLHAVVKISIV